MKRRETFNRFCRAIVGISAVISTANVGSYGQQSTVTIDISGAKSTVSNAMYGTLMERLGRQWAKTGVFVGTASTIPNVNGMRKDVIDAFKECGVGAAQWPGGCAAWGYEWSPPNPANDVGTDRFLEFCKLTGAEPVICGPHKGTSAASNLAWLKHIDSTTAKLGMDSLRWFKIGNEVWGGCGAGMDVSTYCTNYLDNYNRMSAYRSSLKFESCSQNEDRGYASVSGWFKTLISSLGAKTHGIEYHDYIFRTTWNSLTFPAAQYWQIMYDGTVGDFAGHMRTNVIPVLDEADPGKKIKLIVDEWGDWLLGDNWMQTGTLMNALSAANQLHLMMSNADRIEVACIAQGISVIHSLLNINTSSEMVKTPTFYVFKMFKPHHSNGAKWAPITASNIETSKQSAEVSGSVTLPMLTVGSTVNADGRVNISVNNIDPASSRKIVISLTSNQTEYLIDSAQIVTGPATNSNNPFGGAEVVNLQNFAASNYTLGANGKTLTATLPARSIVMFRLKPPPVGVGIKRDEKANGLSIATGSRGTLIIKSPVDRMTPVKISLFSVDGKTLMKTFSANVTPGNENIIRLVGDHSPGTGMFIVQVEAGGVVQAKRIMY